MIIIAIANQRGGVGETTTAVNLSAALVRSKRRVLLVGLDAQGTATSHLQGAYGADGRVIYNVLMRQATLRQVIARTPSGGDLAPNNPSMSSLDSDIINEYRREERLKTALEECDDNDYVMIDCPPQLATTTVAAFTAADAVLIPVEYKPEAWEAVPRLFFDIENPRRRWRR